MIYVMDNNGANVFSVKNTIELFNAIMAEENNKLLEDHPHFGQSSWSFVHYTSARIKMMYKPECKYQYSPILQQAFEQSIGYVEICTGDFTKPKEILLTDSVDILSLKKQWCNDYCHFHNYRIMVTNGNENLFTTIISAQELEKKSSLGNMDA